MTVALILRDRILADSRLNDENQPLTVGKIFKRKGGGLFVTAGDSRLTYSFERAMCRGKEPVAVDYEDDEDDEEFDGALLTKDRAIVVYDKNFAPFLVSEPWVALGSAYDVVRSWMLHDADPVDAMRRAIEVDRQCGFPIVVAHLDGRFEIIES